MNPMRNYFGGGGQNNGGPGLPGPFGNVMNVFNKFKEFMQNPVGAMLGSGINIPQNIQNNPEKKNALKIAINELEEHK